MKILKTYEDFIIEADIYSIGNNPNLSINYNIKKGRTFNDDGYSISVDGDGPSATDVVIPLKQNIKKVKLRRGSNVEKEQKDRKIKNKKNNNLHRIAATVDFQTTDDITNFSVDRKPNCDA